MICPNCQQEMSENFVGENIVWCQNCGTVANGVVVYTPALIEQALAGILLDIDTSLGGKKSSFHVKLVNKEDDDKSDNSQPS